MKTPEELANEFADSGLYRLKRYVDGRIKPAQGQHGLQHLACRHGFLAGYQAAKDEEATKDQKIAALWAENIKNMLPSVHEIVLFPSDGDEQSKV